MVSEPASSRQPDSLRIVVPFAAGGTTDLTARILADTIQQHSGQSVTVENRPGGFAAVALDHVMRQPADGRTLFIIANGVTTQKHYLPNARNPLNELAIVSIIAESPMVLLSAGGLPIESATDLISYARSNPNRLNYGTVGQGGTLQMAADLLQRSAGISMTAVGYQGGAPATTDLIAGRIQVLFDSVAVGAQTIRSGSVRPLAVTSPNRSRFMPEVPTFNELGYDINFTPWQAIFVSAATPEPIKYRLNNTIRRALQNPAAVQRYIDIGMERVLGTTVFESERVLDQEVSRWNSILESR